MGYPPVVVVDSGGVPRTQVAEGASAPAFTVVESGARPITLTDNAPPIALFNPDGSPWSAWTPEDLQTDLVAWWSADRADLITTSGGLITSWKDVVAGYDKVQGTGTARPAYSATGFNGAPCADYDGSDDQLTLTGVPAPFPIGADPCEMWVVFDNEAPGADTATRRLFTYGGATTATARAITLVGTAGTQFLSGFVGTGGGTSFAISASGDAGGRHAGRAIITAAGVSVQLDGGTIPTEQAGVPATTDGVVRSGLGTNGAGPLNGKIRHIAVTLPLAGVSLAAMQAWAQIQRRA